MENGLFNNPNLILALQQLAQSGQNSEVNQILKNLQVSGQLNSFENSNVSGYNYGGRVGYGFPTNEGMFRAGITGQGFNANTPVGTMKDFNVTGGDIGYSQKDQDLSLSYNRQGGTGGVPLLQLLFKKYFD